MSRARQRRATIPVKQRSALKERRVSSFISFLDSLILELNQLAADSWVALVEGERDVRALRRLGYNGRLVKVSDLRGMRFGTLDGVAGVVILTDLDSEGGRLASKFARMLAHELMPSTLTQRRRLLVASKGVFRHIENLGRFAEAADG
jgi:5S rRNA maturation endonuclease (ribonuclease M5)